MAILSKTMLMDVRREYRRTYGVVSRYMAITGQVSDPDDKLQGMRNTRQRRDYALQQSINEGRPYVFQAAPYVFTWVVGLEDRRMVHGGLLAGEVCVAEEPDWRVAAARYLEGQGLTEAMVAEYLGSLPLWPGDRVREAADALQRIFYEISGWQPDLMAENRLKARQQEQIRQAIEDRRRDGGGALYAFEKERMLLANMRAGERQGARKLLNDMLASIYMSSQNLPVLRARAIELMSCLTRAAIEDNPLLEPIIERNHGWTERLVTAHDFEHLSTVLMEALDDFIEGIYIHGVNRSNMKVRTALDHIQNHFREKLTVDAVAAAVGLSASRLSHLVKQYTGRTVLQIVQQMRIQHARHLLERSSMSCTEIAYEVGFNDQSYFTKHFKRLTGTTPARYRASR